MQFVVTFIISKTKIVGTDSVVSLTKQRQGHLRVLYDITDYEKFSLLKGKLVDTKYNGGTKYKNPVLKRWLWKPKYFTPGCE